MFTYEDDGRTMRWTTFAAAAEKRDSLFRCSPKQSQRATVKKLRYSDSFIQKGCTANVTQAFPVLQVDCGHSWFATRVLMTHSFIFVGSFGTCNHRPVFNQPPALFVSRSMTSSTVLVLQSASSCSTSRLRLHDWFPLSASS